MFDTIRPLAPREPTSQSQNQHPRLSIVTGPPDVDVDSIPSIPDESPASEIAVPVEISAPEDAPAEHPSQSHLDDKLSDNTLPTHIPPPNIIIFGATGAGKSSVVNMIANDIVATTSSDATGCTFQSEPHPVEIDGSKFVLWDTSGLNEGDKGRVPAEKAVENLYALARGLSQGVSLLVYCVRGPRINANTADNFDLFFRGLCQEKVPIILVVTALEGVTSKDEWWQENEPTYREQGMEFAGHACVVATRGKKRDGKYLFEEEYNISQSELRRLLCESVKDCPMPWVIEVNGWIGAIANVVCRAMGIGPTAFSHVVRQLQIPSREGGRSSSRRGSSPDGRRTCYNYSCWSRESKLTNFVLSQNQIVACRSLKVSLRLF